MNRLDRALGILLFLRSGKGVSAAELARRFEVSPRTIYRDVELLSALGVPIYAERGRGGGFRLLEGYFLPPIMFTQDEALGLMVSLSLLESLRAKPFAAALETAERKLVAAVSEQLRATLLEARKRIGVEIPPNDIFHPERSLPQETTSTEAAQPQRPSADENHVVQVFLQGVFTRRAVNMQYRSPYRSQADHLIIEPLGAFWDRDYWYLVGTPTKQQARARQWRADRVIEIRLHPTEALPASDFTIGDVLGRNWLKDAMQHWRHETPVRIRLTRQQASRLQQDWYYRHAHYAPLDEHNMLVTFGEDHTEAVLELLRWLGPGAELLEPREWRETIRAQLTHLLELYRSETPE